MIRFLAPDYIALPRWAAEELLKAPANCTKLYLYGCLRTKAEDLEQISAETGLSSREVMEGLEMLRTLGLVSADENAAEYRYQAEAPRSEEATQAVYGNTEFNMQLQALFSDRILSMNDYAAFYECREVYGLPESVVLMLAEACITHHKAKNRLPMSMIRKVGREWAQEGIDTVERAAVKMESFSTEKEGAREVLRMLAIRRPPTDEEESLYHKWTKDWGFSMGGIRASMVATTRAQYPSMKYLDTILKELYLLGKVTYNDVSQHFLKAEEVESAIKRLLGRIGAPHRTVTEDQRKLYSRWRTMGFGEKEIAYAASVAGSKGYAAFDHIDKLLTGWRMRSLTTLEEIEELRRSDEQKELTLKSVFAKAGIAKQPTRTDHERYDRMVRKYGFAEDIMMFAAECAYGYGSPMKAMETILSGWKDAKVETLEQAREENRRHRERMGGAKQQQRFEEREYTKEELDSHIDDPLAEILKELEE